MGKTKRLEPVFIDTMVNIGSNKTDTKELGKTVEELKRLVTDTTLRPRSV